MKKIIVLSVACLLCACSHEVKNEISKDQDQAFDRYKQAFVLDLWKLHPGWASSMGFHKYDSVLSIPDEARKKQEKAFYTAQLDSLGKFSTSGLSDYNKTDCLMMRDYLRAAVWGMDTLKEDTWNPAAYNVCGSFAEMLNNNYDSLDQRLRNFAIRQKSVPAYYAAAQKNISNPTKEHTELAILQNEGGVSVFESDLVQALEKSHLTESEKQQVMADARLSAAAVRKYCDFLKTLNNPQPRSFRLGEYLYSRKFFHDLQSGYTAAQIYEKALARKTELHGKMYGLTRELWPKYFKTPLPQDSLLAIRAMIDHLSTRHVKPEDFQSSIEKQIPELVKFIRDKNLIYLDSTKPLVVRKEPAYMAGMAGASISSPGPYDLKGNTYYNVGSMSGWSKERAESYLREYNQYILQILNIHEAIPGHYTQLIYSNQSAGGSSKGTHELPGIIKSIFGNGAMVEGWAVYSELMMLENGYGAPQGSNTAEPEMWLMYYKWNLRSTCNTILDYAIHVKNLGREDGINLLTREAFQQQAEAENKWRRATLSQVQLCSYFTGFTEICALREEIKKVQGAAFNLKKFHEQFLSYGSAPVKYIGELMGAIKN